MLLTLNSPSFTGLIDGDLDNPLKFRQCGSFRFEIQDVGETVCSIVCEKCMPIGKYLTIQNGVEKPLTITDIHVFGIEAELILPHKRKNKIKDKFRNHEIKPSLKNGTTSEKDPEIDQTTTEDELTGNGFQDALSCRQPYKHVIFVCLSFCFVRQLN